MEAKDTVMSRYEVENLLKNTPLDISGDLMRVAQQQAAISFKAGKQEMLREFEDDFSALASYDPEMFDGADLIKTVESIISHWQAFVKKIGG